MLLVAAAMMSLSAFGVAYAGEGEASARNGQSTQIAGVVTQAPAQGVRPVALAGTAGSPQYFLPGRIGAHGCSLPTKRAAATDRPRFRNPMKQEGRL